MNIKKNKSATKIRVERECSSKTLDYQSCGPKFDTQPDQDMSETLCISHPARGELV